ncbi:MAG: SAM-dependent chlorinase/fluorinase [Bergeyella sp.]
MPIITLTSDYGLTDYRVAAIKGKILSLNEDIKIVDISHDIQAYNLSQTSYIVRNAYRFFPKGTVHIISVDSFYTKHRKSIVYKADEQYFIAADNGVLSLVFFDQKPEAVYEITFNNRFDDVVEFVSTDIFVPVAVHLQNGGLPEVIGRPYKTPKQIKFLKPTINKQEKMIIGEVMYIDHFGNLISNISKSFFDKMMVNYQSFKIKIRSLVFTEMHEYYTDVVKDWEHETDYHSRQVAIFNEAGLLELSIYKGHKTNGASTLFGMNTGDKIYIEFE